MKFSLTILASLAISASASPISLEYRDSSCTLGQLYCNGPSQWALCGPLGLQWGAVAAGTECINGQIVAAGSSGSAASTAAPAASSPATSAAPAPSPVSSQAPAASSAPATTSAAAPVSSSAASSPAAAATSAASSGSSSSGGSTTAAGSTYKMFKGDGSTSAGWPAMSDWVTWDILWNANKPVFSASCTQFKVPNNSDQENSDMEAAIKKLGASSGVDPRMILAIIMQESKGCVRVWSTSYSVVNPGLMQSANGKGSCNTGTSAGGGTVSNPCPSSQIEQMITDGTTGTGSGVSLKDLGATGSDAKAYYTAARKYNSGSVAADGDLSSPSSVATKCYSSDVSNRLLGWSVATGTGCTLDGAA